MIRNNSLLSDGLWVAVMQLGAAVGQLIGIRILTSVLPPDVFGESILWVGIVQLVSTAVANPTMQALLRFYPEYALLKMPGLVRDVVNTQLRKILISVLPILIIGLVVVLVVEPSNALTVLLLGLLISVEISRTHHQAILNAVHSHRAYGVWILIEAWARPLFAWILIKIAGISAIYVIAGYFLASLLCWISLAKFVPYDQPSNQEKDDELSDRVWKYTLPLLPLGVLGWVFGMSDRYMIGALLSTKEVGLYAAVYSLASRPMLMLGNIIETTMRPLYQSVLLNGETQLANRYLHLWLRLVVLGCFTATVVTWYGHGLIAEWLLGENYREASAMMPWIVAGFSLLLLSNIAIRICYAHEDTKNILVIETGSTLLAIAISYVCILEGGIWGAAMAVPINYAVKMVLSLWFVQPWLASTKPVKDK